MSRLEKQVLLQTIGINSSNYTSLEAIHKDLDKLIAQHVNPTQQVNKKENTINLEGGYRPSLYPDPKRNFSFFF